MSKDPSNKLIDTKDLVFVWKLIRKNIGILLVIPILSYVVGIVYTHRLNNIYEYRAQLLLKSNETYDYQDPIYKGLGAYGVYMDVQNQMRIVSSRDLIGKVIDKLDLGTSYFVVGSLKTVEVFETLPFKAEFKVENTTTYEIPIKVVVLNINSYSVSYELDGERFELKGVFNKKLQGEDFSLTLINQYQFTEENLPVIQSSDYELVFHSRDYLIERHQQSLSVVNIENTSILEVSSRDQLDLRAKVFLDTLTDTYIKFSKQSQLEVNQNTLDNIDKQIDTVLIFIKKLENDLITYRDEHAITNITEEEAQLLDEYVEHSRELRVMEAKISALDGLKTYLNSSDDNRVLPSGQFIEKDDYYLAEAVNTLRSRQVDLEIKKSNHKEDHEEIRNLKKEIAMLKSDILDYIKNARNTVSDDLDKVKLLIMEVEKKLMRLPRSVQDITNIQRELDVNTKMYVFLLEKKTNTLIARAGIIPQVRLIEETASMGLVEPDKTKIIRLFVLGGFILAFIIAILRKLFFERVNNVDELALVTRLGIAGGIPYLKELRHGIIVNSGPKSHVTESFRVIRSNLTFLTDARKSSNLIVVSSFFPGEGKTFCSSNLATLIASGSKKTVLIDFDLHRPRVHKMFNLENNVGVSNYITGRSNLDEITRKNLQENLDVITSGPIAPNPSELILRDDIPKLFEELKAKYEMIIIDTPPFGFLSDTFELLKSADVFLVILNTRYTRVNGLNRMEALLAKFDNINKSVVLNGVRESKLKYYYSKYSYKYGYGYGYGYGSYGYGYGQRYGYGYESDPSADDLEKP